MPLIDPTPIPPVIPVSTDPVVAPPKYNGITVNTKYVPATALLTHVEGSSWTVDYYSQVLNTNSALNGQNQTQNPIYQQYKLITGMELKVTSPLTTSQDANSKAMISTGTANVYPFIIPNEGDMFLADIGDGNEGIFKITLSERKSIYKDTIHTIEYQLIDYTNLERIGDLNLKVIDTLVFVKDYLKFGQNPLLQPSDFDLMNQLQDYYFELLSRYFRTFTSKEFRTLLLPGQAWPVYDHFLTKALLSFFTTYDVPELRTIKILNLDDDDVMDSTTIWDMVIEKNRNLHKYCIRQNYMVSAKLFTQNPMMEGIYHSGIQYVIYPVDPVLEVDSEYGYKFKTQSVETLTESSSQITNLSDLLFDTNYEGVTLPATSVIKTVMTDNYYVLSKAFYDRDETKQSELELCLSNYLDSKVIDKKALLSLCSVAHAWNGLERFYYVPILLMILKSAVINIS